MAEGIVMERCWVLTRGERGEVEAHRPRVGGVASVEADWGWALAREEERGDVVGFWHTHPAGAGTAPSSRDIRTMQAWCSALGKPLLCLISEEGQEGEAAVYWFEDDESEGEAAGIRGLGDFGFWIGDFGLKGGTWGNPGNSRKG